MKAYNYYGKEITGIKPVLADPLYGSYDSEGNPIINWLPEDDFVDGYGFDKTRKGSDGFYRREIFLPKGTLLCRYGRDVGRMTTVSGTSYDTLGLPYKKESVEYHEYVVIADGVRVKCMVFMGYAYPTFGSAGGGVQYLHPTTIRNEIAAGKIKEDFTWLRKKSRFV